jgi:glycosyltransferase involved in cell wall biosynthesis
VPVVVELTGEDIFLDALADPHRTQVRDAIRARVGDVKRFVATSHYYADRMAEYLAIPREKIDVVYPGLPKEYLDAVPVDRPSPNGHPPTVGYLARICPEKGIERLVDAMILLRQKPGMQNVQLRAAGYLGKKDEKFFHALRKRIDNSPLRGGMHYLGQVDQAGKIELLRSADVFSAPSVYPESKGIYVLESLAAGTPVVQPAHGSFPELLAKTEGGTLTPPGDAPALANALAEMLQDPDRRTRHGTRGREVVHAEFTDTHMAHDMLRIFQEARA